MRPRWEAQPHAATHLGPLKERRQEPISVAEYHWTSERLRWPRTALSNRSWLGPRGEPFCEQVEVRRSPEGDATNLERGGRKARRNPRKPEAFRDWNASRAIGGVVNL